MNFDRTKSMIWQG